MKRIFTKSIVWMWPLANTNAFGWDAEQCEYFNSNDHWKEIFLHIGKRNASDKLNIEGNNKRPGWIALRLA